MNKRKIVIDLIMSNTCNRRCQYCPINFDWKVLTKENIDFVLKYLDDNESCYDECTINFFGWEPLLSFENIKYFVENNKNNKIRYTMWTNWILFSEERLDFIIKHNIKVYLTFHADNTKTYKEILKKQYLTKWLSLIQINFIVSPIDIDFVYEKIDQTVLFWFKNINIIPVMLTIPWTKKAMVKLKKFIWYVDQKYIYDDKYNYLKIYKFSYFDWTPIEIWFVIDTDLNIYQDSSDELYIGKQYIELWNDLMRKVEDFSLIWNLKKDLNFQELINKYDIKNIIKMLYSLPEKLWYIKDYLLVYRIMNDNQNHRSNMWGNIYNVFVSK